MPEPTTAITDTAQVCTSCLDELRDNPDTFPLEGSWIDGHDHVPGTDIGTCEACGRPLGDKDLAHTIHKLPASSTERLSNTLARAFGL